MAKDSGPTQTSRNPSRCQALNACDACRRRKSKCDEGKPACGRCVRLNLDCSYVETVAAKKNLSVLELAETLKRMDEKLNTLTSIVQENRGNCTGPSRQTEHTTREIVASPSTNCPTAFSPTVTSGLGNPYTASSPFLDTGRVLEELSLSQRHSTAPQHLLSWPCSSLQMSGLDLQYPMDLEINRPKLSQSKSPPLFIPPCSSEEDIWLSRLSLSQVSLLTQSYFRYFHPSCLVMDEAHFYSHTIPMAMQETFAKSFNTCRVLYVCALGSIAAYYSGHEQLASGPKHEVGIEFFNLASEMFRDLEGVNWDSVQCLLLMEMFYSAKMRVYDAWHANHRACCTILILVPLQGILEAQHCQLFWIAYLHESQILAEFDFPASGLGKLASNTPLPLIPENSDDPSRAKYQFFFLALISMRKLLNRILFYLYNRDHSKDDQNHNSPAVDRSTNFSSASESVIQELDRQLEEWRMFLPQGLQFPSHSGTEDLGLPEPHEPRTTDQRLLGHLMARYYSAKSIIHRPFVYRTLHCDQFTLLSETDKFGTSTAVGSAFMSVIHSGIFHEPLELLLHPINSCRSLFAVEVQFAFLSYTDFMRDALPNERKSIEEARRIIVGSATQLSPTVIRDGEILQLLV